MKKRKLLLKELSETIFNKNNVTISKSKCGDLYFEIGDLVTSDIAEAVSILMRRVDENDPIWKTEVKDIDIRKISPEKSLFWLSGGYLEWESLKNYSIPWSESYIYFQEEFGFLIVNAVSRSNTLKDIKEYFLKYLNLPTLYDFAISKKIVDI